MDDVDEAVLGRVRELAQETFNIYWTDHALERMDQRDIKDQQALRVLRSGTLQGELELIPDNDWKMTLGRRCAGRLVRVVAVLGESELVVLTAY